MTKTFADTFYFLALLNPKDMAHPRAVAAARTIQGQLVTTSWVLTELADAMSAPENRQEFISTFNDLRQNPAVVIVPPDSRWFDEGIELFSRRADKSWSLTDCISFVVMQREGIRDALTGDKHFEQAGFVALLK
jgi:predicted nucleic acid-binding protein